jgi:hypothetical protein
MMRILSQAEMRDVKKYLRVHLRIEHATRQQAALRLQARWRGVLARMHDARCARMVRSRRLKRRSPLLLTSAVLHVSDTRAAPTTSTAALGGLPARRMPAVLLQAHVRGVLVRRRVGVFRAQHGAATHIQARARGVRGRRRVGGLLCISRLEARVGELEAELGRERRLREVHELALRKLWDAQRGASREAGLSTPSAGADRVGAFAERTPLTDESAAGVSPRMRECATLDLSAAAAREDYAAAASRMQAAWRSHASVVSPTVVQV